MQAIFQPRQPEMLPQIILSEEQEEAKELILKWYLEESHRKAYFKLFGYAGTGKTTLADMIVKSLGLTVDEVICAAFTGKAASVIQAKTGIPSYTIHALTYAFAGIDEAGRPIFTMRDESKLQEFRVKLLILDECSMVTEDNFRDLNSWGCPILALGDPAQLPPIKGVPFFQKEPDYQLEEIQRQVGESAAIARFANAIRNFGLPTPDGEYVRVVSAGKFDPAEFLLADQVLCGTNATRVSHNQWQRTQRGRAALNLPEVGERVICLLNNKNYRIYNGEIMEVTDIRESEVQDIVNARVKYESQPGIMREFTLPMRTTDFNKQKPIFERGMQGTPFDFAYAITVHKAQGSEWDNVVIMDDRLGIRDPVFRQQWLYTALTRARKKVTIVSY